jgi:hypothetical protein
VLEAEVKRLIRLRHELPVLRRGELGAPLLVDANVMVLPRRLGKVMAITASNNAPETRTVTVAVPADAPGAFVDAVDGRPVPLRDGHLLIDLPPHGGQVLIAR